MSDRRKNILIVDDDEKILFAFREVFRKDGYHCIVARNGNEAVKRVASDHPHVVIMDVTMPELDGLEALKSIREASPSIPVILITGFGTMQTAIKAMQYGAFEYLTKPLDIRTVRDVVRKALSSSGEQVATSAEPVSFHAQIVNRYEIVGSTPGMQEVYKLIGSVSTTPSHTSVLILGESGTGKELVARAIHANSRNAAEPFVAINCTALPETLLESELFGYEKGAFTGATDRKLGKFEVASRGTIFLDEVGNLPLHLQQKLLRVLQEREFERLGGNEPQKVSARFIAATNQDLAAEVKMKTFREDLFFRLNVVSIHLPPLRERDGDIMLLAMHFLRKYNEQLGKHVRGFSDDAARLILHYPFPGNVRELENLVERAVMLTNGEIIQPHVFGKPDHRRDPRPTTLPISSPVFSKARKQLLATFEKQFVVQQLEACHGNVTAAAKASKMTRQNFQRLMKTHHVDSSDFRK